MSSLFIEEGVEQVKITLNKRDGSGSDSFYLGLDYYAANAIYSGSAETFPVLAASPAPHRSMGRHLSDLHSIDLDIFGKVAFDSMDRCFYDLHDDYEFRNAEVVVYYYPKPTDAVVTSATANTRQTLSCEGFQWNPQTGIVSLTCVDAFFPEAPMHKYLDADVFTDMPTDWQDEIGPIAIGRDVIIDSPVVDSTLVSIDLFTAFEFPGHQVSGNPTIYAKNNLRNIDADEWLEIDLSPTDPVVGSGITYAYSADGEYSLQDGPRGVLMHLTDPTIIASVTMSLTKHGTPTSATGSLKVNLYQAEELATSSSWEPVGSALDTISIDPALISASGHQYAFAFDKLQPLPAGYYMVCIEWSNRTEATDYIAIDYTNSVGSWTFFKDTSDDEGGWAKITSRELALDVNAFEGDSLTHETTGARYAYYTLSSQGSILPSVGVSYAERQFKSKIDGLKDDGSGTYTGSASDVIRNASDAIRFFLLNSELGNLGSSAIDTDTFDDVRDDLVFSPVYETGFNLSLAIDRESYVLAQIAKICEQCRIQFYHTRAGKLALRYPTYSSTAAHTYTQTDMRSELQLVAVKDNDASSVINAFSYLHGPNPLNQPTDPAFLRRAKTDKYSGLVYLNADDSSDSDTTREGNMGDSEDLYGRYTHSLQVVDLLDSAAAVEKLRDYNADRYSTLQKRIEFRVPRRKWYNDADMFDILKIEHGDLPDADGTYSSDESDSQAYSDGLPIVSAALGSVWGECVEVVESGEWMTLIIETVSSY